MHTHKNTHIQQLAIESAASVNKIIKILHVRKATSIIHSITQHNEYIYTHTSREGHGSAYYKSTQNDSPHASKSSVNRGSTH